MEQGIWGRFGAFHPVVLFVYFASLLVLLIFQFHPVVALLGLSGGLPFLFIIKSGSKIKKMLLFYLLFFFVLTVTNLFFTHEGQTPLFYINDKPVTLESGIYGAVMAALLIAVLIWCQCMQVILTSDKILYLMGKSIPRTALVFTMSFRFLPLFLRQMKKIARAQKAMGLYAGDSVYDKAKGGVRILSSLIGWSLENAMDTACSMKARGYGIRGRNDFSLFRFRKSDALMLALILVLTGTVFLGIVRRDITFSCYPAVSTVSFTLPACTAYAAFGILTFLPFLTECRERIKWKHQKENIHDERVGDATGIFFLPGCKKTGA